MTPEMSTARPASTLVKPEGKPVLAEAGEQIRNLSTEVRRDAEPTQNAGTTPTEARIVTPEMSTAHPASTLVTPEGKPVPEG